MTEQEVRAKIDRLVKLGSERQIRFIGMGQMPIRGDTGDVDFEVWELLGELLEDDAFYKFWTTEVMGD